MIVTMSVIESLKVRLSILRCYGSCVPCQIRWENMTVDNVSVSIGIDYWERVLDVPIYTGPGGVDNNLGVGA